ncbi:hypothetical protein L2E82_41987 [Cichorium intybus]|uniref:Uncharacterized protein n=1 Tax=Cichorium intybus TaxID=13427 RepID=A0ACB8ZQP1_CICIN|nr:hypothetical protein L2E82_41987 [Cichorium intybus]
MATGSDSVPASGNSFSPAAEGGMTVNSVGEVCPQFYQVCQLRPTDEVGGYVRGEGIVVCSNYMNIQDETQAGHLSGDCHYKRELLRGQIYDVSSDAKSRFCQKVPLKISTCIYVSPDLLKRSNFFAIGTLISLAILWYSTSPFLYTCVSDFTTALVSGTGVMKADEVKGNINIDDV